MINNQLNQLLITCLAPINKAWCVLTLQNRHRHLEISIYNSIISLLGLLRCMAISSLLFSPTWYACKGFTVLNKQQWNCLFKTYATPSVHHPYHYCHFSLRDISSLIALWSTCITHPYPLETPINQEHGLIIHLVTISIETTLKGQQK